MNQEEMDESIKDNQQEKPIDQSTTATEEEVVGLYSSSEHESTFTEPMETSTLEEEHLQSAMVDDDTHKPSSILLHSELIAKAENMFGETKEYLLDMIQELQDLRVSNCQLFQLQFVIINKREQELAKYQSLCAKDLDSARTTSLAEMDIISSIVKKNEQERERLERHYMERIKELSSERDLLMKESLDSKLKFEAQQVVFEQIKVCFSVFHSFIISLREETLSLNATVPY
ncbi:predicted protein [Naegleria gruberi]|uniref:Predicted protein n=1 Tax=Naegleria gruberi TaxID=5762 RepID=D2VER0_NAEGR|nr:uncharacterized protein NAEGRDRAFT_67361 [Naegleria gruberi]EFC44645.1 predicted protein [Naegleria gruberi]|eukprot:XP_002677389.1 predicted protein [Naegleria gruberi strain NEG-M]